MTINPPQAPINKSSELVERENFKKFINIQLAFAVMAMKINGISYEDAVFGYTAIYRNVLKLPTPMNKDNFLWREFVSQCLSAGDAADSTWEFVKTNESDKKHEQENKFDPFSYKFDSSKSLIVLHFGGDNKSIDIKNSSYLRRKLKMMFDEIRVSHPDATQVEAYSWMIKFAARIFPKEFISSAVPQQGWFKTEAIWGQFKTISGMREKAVQDFLDKVEKATSNEDLQNAFPYQSLHAICDIRYFYEMSL